MIQCVDIQCINNTDQGPYIIDNRYNSTGWYNSMYYVGNNKLLFMYYNNNTFTLDYTYYHIYGQTIKHGTFISNVHGGWLSNTLTNINQIASVYVDILSGDYKYALCNISENNLHLQCIDNIIIDKNISDNINDYDLWVYPHIIFEPTFNPNPITTYFDINKLMMAQCNNILCNNTYLQQIANGSYGFGRDSSIEWYNKYNILYISFLDYNQNGTDKKLRLIIASPMLQ